MKICLLFCFVLACQCVYHVTGLENSSEKINEPRIGRGVVYGTANGNTGQKSAVNPSASKSSTKNQVKNTTGGSAKTVGGSGGAKQIGQVTSGGAKTQTGRGTGAGGRRQTGRVTGGRRGRQTGRRTGHGGLGCGGCGSCGSCGGSGSCGGGSSAGSCS